METKGRHNQGSVIIKVQQHTEKMQSLCYLKFQFYPGRLRDVSEHFHFEKIKRFSYDEPLGDKM